MAAASQDAGQQAATDAAAAAAQAAAATQTTTQQQTTATPEWFLADGIKGTGARPDYFKHDKYKSLAEQAKAYVDAEKQIGVLTAKIPKPAPDKYELPGLEAFGGDVEWKADDPLLAKAFEVAKKHGVSQETFNDMALNVMLPIIRNYEMIDPAAEKTSIGERADERMDGLKSWAKANLSEEQYALVVAPLGKWSRPHEVFAALETVLQATRQPSLADKEAATTTMTKAEWEAKWYAKSDKPQYRYKIDEPGNRDLARAELAGIVGTGNHIEVVGKKA